MGRVGKVPGDGPRVGRKGCQAAGVDAAPRGEVRKIVAVGPDGVRGARVPEVRLGPPGELRRRLLRDSKQSTGIGWSEEEVDDETSDGCV